MLCSALVMHRKEERTISLDQLPVIIRKNKDKEEVVKHITISVAKEVVADSKRNLLTLKTCLATCFSVHNLKGDSSSKDNNISSSNSSSKGDSPKEKLILMGWMHSDNLDP